MLKTHPLPLLLILFGLILPAPDSLAQTRMPDSLLTTMPPQVFKGGSFSYVIRADTLVQWNPGSEDTMKTFRIHAIEIYRPGATAFVQTNPHFVQRFFPEENDHELWRYSEIPFFTVDANFDGHEDIYILNFAGMYWNVYQFYLYDPKIDQFREDTFLVKIMDPTFHPEGKYIHTSWHAGVSEFAHQIFQWKGTELLLMAEEIEYWGIGDPDEAGHSGRQRVNGVLTEVAGGPPCQHTPRGFEGCDLYERMVKEKK